MIPRTVSTEDGSITAVEAVSGELYHNRAGAFTEALKNYVEPSNLRFLMENQSSLRLLDVCFGLGYNTLVLLDQCLKIAQTSTSSAKHFSVHLLGIDRDPHVLQLIPLVLEDHRFINLVNALQQATAKQSNVNAWWRSFGSYQFNLGRQENLSVNLEIRQADIRQEVSRLVTEHPQSFDLIFHDGFSPRQMPQLWTIDLFRFYVQLLKPGGKILTYSAASAVRGALNTLGLIVKRTASVGGKSGGTMAILPPYSFDSVGTYDLTEAEKNKLKSRSATPYCDPNLDAGKEEILARREKELRLGNLSQ